MKIIAVDDEKLQLETIIEYVLEIYPGADCIGFHKVSDVLAYMEVKNADVAILDISMPGNLNGIHLGEVLRQKNPRMKLLYCTGYADYAMDAFKIHANGYLQKPIMKEALKRELQYIVQMPVFDQNSKPYIQTFGLFDLYVNEHPVLFRRSKSKEILAYLTDREGSWISNRELVVALWDDTGADLMLTKYISTLVKDLIVDLENVGVSHILERKRGQIRLLRNEVVCDYFDYLRGDLQARSRFHNEYMKQYSWGETTLAALLKREP